MHAISCQYPSSSCGFLPTRWPARSLTRAGCGATHGSAARAANAGWERDPAPQTPSPAARSAGAGECRSLAPSCGGRPAATRERAPTPSGGSRAWQEPGALRRDHSRVRHGHIGRNRESVRVGAVAMPWSLPLPRSVGSTTIAQAIPPGSDAPSRSDDPITRRGSRRSAWRCRPPDAAAGRAPRRRCRDRSGR